MSIDEIKSKSVFLWGCRANYFSGIRPGDQKSKSLPEYTRLKEIALLYFQSNLQEEFSHYLMEGQYLVQLWTAHFILEYGTPDKELTKACLKEIENYSQIERLPEVATQERDWLNQYYLKNRLKG